MSTIYIDLVQDPKTDSQAISFLAQELQSRGWEAIKPYGDRVGDEWDYARFKLEDRDLESFKSDVKSLCIPFNLKSTFNRHLISFYYLLEEKP